LRITSTISDVRDDAIIDCTNAANGCLYTNIELTDIVEIEYRFTTEDEIVDPTLYLNLDGARCSMINNS